MTKRINLQTQNCQLPKRKPWRSDSIKYMYLKSSHPTGWDTQPRRNMNLLCFNVRSSAVRVNAEKERDARKRALAEKRRKDEERKILDVIKARGISVEQKKGTFKVFQA